TRPYFSRAHRPVSREILRDGNLEDSASVARAALVCHAEEIAVRIAYEFADGRIAAGRRVEVEERGFGPASLARHEPEDEAGVADSVAGWAASRGCPDERAGGIRDDAALREGAVEAAGEIVKDVFGPGGLPEGWRGQLEDDAAADDVQEPIGAAAAA